MRTTLRIKVQRGIINQWGSAPVYSLTAAEPPLCSGALGLHLGEQQESVLTGRAGAEEAGWGESDPGALEQSHACALSLTIAPDLLGFRVWSEKQEGGRENAGCSV